MITAVQYEPPRPPRLQRRFIRQVMREFDSTPEPERTATMRLRWKLDGWRQVLVALEPVKS